MFDPAIIAYSVLGAGFTWLLLSPRIAERLYRSVLFEALRFPAGDWSVQTKFASSPEDVYFSNDRQETLHGWLFTNSDAAATLIVNHGNSGNIADLPVLLELLLKAPANLLVYDYRGFGRSEGAPSTAAVCEDAVSAYDYVYKRFPTLPIALYGESIGGGISTYVAQRRKVSGLILQSAFENMRRVSCDLYPIFHLWPRLLFPLPFLDNATALSRLTCPVLFVHGAKDQDVKLAHAQTNFAIALAEKKLEILPNTAHEEIAPEDIEQFVSAVSAFIDSLRLHKRKTDKPAIALATPVETDGELALVGARLK